MHAQNSDQTTTDTSKKQKSSVSNGLREQFLYYSLILIVGAVSGAASVKLYYENLLSSHQYREVRSPQVSTKLTNPLLECESGYENLSNTLTPFEHVVKERIAQLIKENQAEDISYYFRELDNGVWFAVNEDALYIPASLFKVPVMMAVLHESEKNPELLQKKLLYKAKDSVTNAQNIKPSKYLENNKEYTVKELVEQMITESDNEAAYAIAPIVDTPTYDRILSLAQIKIVNDPAAAHVNVIKYSGFFRILYNSSYLGIDQSEQALDMLTHSTFNQGLEAGVPEGTVVAHKFGERRTNDNKLQLHDCGIVYVPQRNYLICVMTKGEDFQKLSQVIAHLSALSYANATK